MEDDDKKDDIVRNFLKQKYFYFSEKTTFVWSDIIFTTRWQKGGGAINGAALEDVPHYRINQIPVSGNIH